MSVFFSMNRINWGQPTGETERDNKKLRRESEPLLMVAMQELGGIAPAPVAPRSSEKFWRRRQVEQRMLPNLVGDRKVPWFDTGSANLESR